MATGPQRYPGANTTYWHQAKWGGSLMEVNVGVLHSTEGIGLPSYDGGGNAPNLTAIADFAAQRLKWFQHFDIDRSSRALRNLSGGVETNTLNVVQVELDGTCDYTKRKNWGSRVAGRDYIYWGDPPDWALRDLAEFLRWLNANHGVPLTGPSMWLTYGPDSRRPGITPASYGASPARMTFAQWNAFKGICGHQHVPENDHGDPGSLPFATLIALAKGTTPPPEEDDMPLSADDLEKVRKTVWESDKAAAPDDAPDRATNPTWQYQSFLKDTNARVRSLEKKLAALTATNDKLVTAVATLAAGIGDLDPAAIVAELRAELEAITIRVDVADA